MSGAIRWLSIVALGLTSCGNSSGGASEANPYMVVAGQVDSRPIVPNRIAFIHVGFDSANSEIGQIYIRVKDNDSTAGEGLFSNLLLSSKHGSISYSLVADSGVKGLPLSQASSGRLHFGSMDTLIAQLEILNGTRKAPAPEIKNGRRIAKPDDLSGYSRIRSDYPQAYIYLFPDGADYDQARSRLDAARINGLDRLSAITSNCSYARMSLDDGDAQAAIMLIHTRRDLIDLNDQIDRQCMLGFFARNWTISMESAERLAFGEEPVPNGVCEYVRILPQAKDRRLPLAEETGCQQQGARPETGGAANHQPEAIVAYVRRRGIGLSPENAQKAVESMRRVCKEFVNAGQDFKASCRSAFEGF